GPLHAQAVLGSTAAPERLCLAGSQQPKRACVVGRDPRDNWDGWRRLGQRRPRSFSDPTGYGAQRNADVEENRRMRLRIGINQGDVVFDNARIYGDGVNIAARLENIAEPGGICMSRKVYEDISGKMQLAFVDAGDRQLKKHCAPMRVYRISGEQL